MNLLGMKKAVATQAPHLEMPHLTIEPVVEKPISVEVGPFLKRLKKLGDSSVLAPKSKPTLGEGSSRKEKGATHPRSIWDLCRSRCRRLTIPTWLGR
ncbi:hypothetical protein BHE74_00040117 [Ensete ventricosum]|nr:hypothetical protein BHE74_00040117 [Ensete ventricosum]